MSFLSRLIGSEKPENTTELQQWRTLPASWYHSPALYELERRAVFSARWLLITHIARFNRVGDYARYVTAGFPFFLILDREKRLQAFHNVCRHRAFPVVIQESGNASILSCKYHGWSYGLSGKLAKAPRFEGIDKQKNSLFPIHVHIDARGFVWINLNVSKDPPLWDESFKGADTQSRLQDFNMDDYRFDHDWSVDGDYNWKTLVDNYNECYHCSVAHPGIAASSSDLTTYSVKTGNGQVQHYVEDRPGTEDPINVAPTFFFPNASVTMTPSYFYIMRVTPTSSTSTHMQYEVYRHKNATDEEFQGMDEFFKQVEVEDKYLCNSAQVNLNAGAYTAGELNPATEQGVLYFQRTLKDTVTNHYAKEKEAGKEVWPARCSIDQYEGVSEEIDFCAALECGKRSRDYEW